MTPWTFGAEIQYSLLVWREGVDPVGIRMLVLQVCFPARPPVFNVARHSLTWLAKQHGLVQLM
jgi:hypothetical protein